MKVKLTLAERYILIATLPAKGTWSTIKYQRVLREALAPTEAEKKEFNVKDVTDPDGNSTRTTWNEKGRVDGREIEVGETMMEVIVKTLKELSENDTLGIGQATLYEKFVDPGPEKVETIAADAAEKPEPPNS